MRVKKASVTTKAGLGNRFKTLVVEHPYLKVLRKKAVACVADCPTFDGSVEQFLALPDFIRDASEPYLQTFVKENLHRLDRYEAKPVKESPWASNLILDQGLDQYCNNRNLARVAEYCAVGTGTTATFTDSDAITVTIAEGTATSSSAFFTSGMVGMLLVTDDGTEQYITGFTSNQVVSVGGSNSATDQTFTVYAVNQTGLASEVKRTNTYLSGEGNCGHTDVDNTRTCKRTYDFSTEVSNQNYTELGWSFSSTSSTNLVSRALVIGGTVTVLTGQQLRVVYEWSLTINPGTGGTPGTAEIDGWPVSPATSLDGDLYWVSGFNSFPGINTNGSANEPIGVSDVSSAMTTPCVGTGSTAPATFASSFTVGSVMPTNYTNSSLEAYVTGSFERKRTAHITVDAGNSTSIRNIGMGGST